MLQLYKIENFQYLNEKNKIKCLRQTFAQRPSLVHSDEGEQFLNNESSTQPSVSFAPQQEPT